MNEQSVQSTNDEFLPYVDFKDLPDTTTPIDATNLNVLQSLIKQDIEDIPDIPNGGTTGQVLAKASNTDGDVQWIDVEVGGGDTTPIGSIKLFGGATAPNGYLFANGQEVSRTEYSDLFNVYGTAFGSGDGSTTFNLPNIKGRVVVGLDPDDNDFDSLGAIGGEKTHTITVNEMPSHNHGIYTDTEPGGTTTNWGISTDLRNSNTKYINTQRISSSGGGQAHNNVQPYITLNYIIKATQTTSTQAQVEDSLTSNSTTNAPSIHAVNTALNNIDLNFLKFKMMEKSNVTVSGNSSTSVDVGTFTVPDGYTFIGILPINNGYGDQWIVSYCRYNNSCVAMIDNHYAQSLTSQLRCCVLFVKTDYFNQNSIA